MIDYKQDALAVIFMAAKRFRSGRGRKEADGIQKAKKISYAKRHANKRQAAISSHKTLKARSGSKPGRANTVAPKGAHFGAIRRNKMSAEEKKIAKEEQILKNKKMQEEQYRIDSKKVIKDLTTNEAVMEYLRKNVSKRAEEVLKALTTTKTDEQIATELNIKINAVRRVLNILHGYGVTNYSTVKNSKGWLSFLWSINLKKIDEFYNYISKEDNVSLITNDSDDYFICEKCYSGNKLIFDFDSAFESKFKCEACGANLKRLSRAEAKELENIKIYEK
ncbi:MAG: hypothetical protein QXK65_03060 [Candidatus Micrarchaeaceae archaeon]